MRLIQVLSAFAAAGFLAFSSATCIAEEKEISFNKDIQVMPANDKASTKIRVALNIDKKRVNPGDTVKVEFQADQDCYLTLMDVGTSGKITRLWPNKFSGPDSRVKGRQRYSFPGAQDKFVFRVSGPQGLERIVAVGANKRDLIIRESDFSGEGEFKSYDRGLKDLVVESSQRTDRLPPGTKWGTAAATLVVGKLPDGGRIGSRSVHVLSIGAATGALKFCDDDARSFARAVTDKLSVPQQNVTLLTGSQGTKARFVQELKALAQKTQPEDLVLVYFSGHGTQIPDVAPIDEADGLDEAFVCYHDKQRLTPGDPDLKNILFMDDEFAALMKQIPARRKVLIADSCHSGDIRKDVSATLTSKYLEILTQDDIAKIKQDKELRVVPTDQSDQQPEGFGSYMETLVAACAENQSSYEDRSKQRGLFTYWLLKNIEGGGGDLRSAFDRARQKVEDETASLRVRQTPHLDDRDNLTKDIKF
ncbi:MAG: caspase family protein [Thermodesulfobacteriota bacterium]